MIMKKQSKNKLIPKVPWTIEEVNALLESKGQDKSLQEKLLDYSRSSEYKFLSELTLDRIPKPLPGVKLTRKELELLMNIVGTRLVLTFIYSNISML